MSSYPPPNQILSVYGIDLVWDEEGNLSGTSSVDPKLLGVDGEPCGVGALVPLVDIMAGTLSARAFRPDWQTTTDVWIHEVTPLRSGPIDVSMRVLRQGKRSLVVCSDVFGQGELVATSTVEFTRISRSASPHSIEQGPAVGEPFRLGSGPLLGRPLDEACGFEVVAPGVVMADKSDFVRNSMGTLQGGAATVLADLAARSIVGAGSRVVDLNYRFLSQTKDGPARATATLIRRTDATATVSVEIVDTSANDAIVGWSVATVDR